MTQLAFPAATIPPANVARVGLFRGIRERLFGAHVKEIKVEDHTRFIGAIGRSIAPVLLICFSLAFSIQLAGPAVVRVWQAIFSHAPFSAVDLVNSVTTNLSVIAMDVSMLLAFIYVRDALVREEPASKWAGFAVYGAIVGIVEAATYLSMLVTSEPPQNVLQWALDIMRSLLAPGSAVFLVVVPQRVLNRKEIIFHILRKVAAAMIKLLDDMTISGQAEFAQLMQLFLHLSAGESGKPQEYMSKLDELLQKISPNAMRAQFETLINELNGQLNEAEARLVGLLRDSLFGLLMTGQLPDHIVDMAPELASVDMSRFAATPNEPPKRKAIAAPGSSDDLRDAASAAGVKTFVSNYAPKDAREVPVMRGDQPVMRNGKPVTKRETKRAYGVWIRSSDVQLFASEKLDADEVRQIIIAAGDSAKDGTTYVAPLKAVLKELSRCKKLHSAFVRFVDSANDSSQSATDSSEDSDEQS